MTACDRCSGGKTVWVKVGDQWYEVPCDECGGSGEKD